MTDSSRLTSGRSEPLLSSAASNNISTGLAPSTNPANMPISTNNTSAFAHNATFPPVLPSDSIPDRPRDVPDLTLRKPSAGGLHLQTHVLAPGQQTLQDQAVPISHDYEDFRSREEHSWTSSGPQIVSRRSWESTGGSPSSTGSSASWGPLGDVTPLPSPIAPSWSSDVWKRAIGRPHSSSSASIERDRAAGLLSPVPLASPPRRKKTYGGLGSSPPAQSDESNDTPERIRALSDFVPAPLVNVRPRNVTGPLSLPLPPPSVAVPPDQKSPLHREKFFAKLRQSVEPSKTIDQSSLLPSPPPSTHTPSEEGEDSPHSFLTVKDSISHHTTHWKTLRQLGTGSFSEVVLATPDLQAEFMRSALSGSSADQDFLVAIKIVSHNSPNHEDEARMDTSIQREIEILQTVSHPSLPRLFAYETNEKQASLVLNYCPGGDLFDLASQQRKHVTPQLIQRIFAELVDATSYLHSLLIVHRDIKLENVLINVPLPALPAEPTTYPSPLVTLTDLGLSKHLPPPPSSPLLTHPCGSVDYAAPELLLGQAYDGRSTDAWALGVLLYALMEGRLPFDPVPNGKRRGTNNIKHRIARCDWLWCEYGDEFGDWKEDAPYAHEMGGAREIVEGLLKKVGRGRWTIDRVKDCEWVRQGLQVIGGLRVP